METTHPTIVLSDKRWLNFRKSFLTTFVLFLAVTVTATIFVMAMIFPDAPWERLHAVLGRDLHSVDWAHVLLAHFDLVLMTSLVCAQFLYLNRAQKLERLTLSPAGISYTSPLPPVLRRFKPDWSLSWCEIGKIELGMAGTGVQNPEFALLTFVTSTGKRRIFPGRWVDAGNYTRPAFRFTFALNPATSDGISKSVMASPVARYISDHHPYIPFDSSLRDSEVFTSLEKDPHGRVALGIVALLILYAIADFVVGPDAYIDEPISLLHIFIAAGVAAAVLSGIWLYRSALASGEKTGLAFLIGMVAAVAMIPGALRVNALTDTVGPVLYDYHVSQGASGVILRPVVEGMPAIEYFARNRFWDKFGRNDTYPVQVRKGALGFYQFNASIIVDDLRKHEGR